MKYQASIFILVLGKFLCMLILFCPKFCWDIFYTNKYKGRSIWAIFSKPAYNSVLKIIHFRCNNATTLSDAMFTATSVTCNTRYPLHIKKPYAYLASRIPNVPDGIIMRILCILEIVIVFLWPILTGTVSITSRLLFRSFFCLHNSATTKGCKNPRHQKWKGKRSRKKICKKQQVLPEIQVKYFATIDNNNDNVFSFDTDCIPFVIDNFSVSIICIFQKLFIGPMHPENVVVDTAGVLFSNTRYIGMIRIILTDDGN